MYFDMFSKRFCENIAIATKVSSILSANPLVFNYNTKHFTLISDNNKIQKLRINYCLAIFWIIISFGFVINLYHGDQADEFYISFVYWIAVVSVSGYNIAVWFPEDFCQTINLTFYYLKHYQG